MSCPVSMEAANVGVIIELIYNCPQQGVVYQVKTIRNKIWEPECGYAYVMRGINTERRA